MRLRRILHGLNASFKTISLFDYFLSASSFGASVGVFFLSIHFAGVVTALLVEYIRLISSRYFLSSLCLLSRFTPILPCRLV